VELKNVSEVSDSPQFQSYHIFMMMSLCILNKTKTANSVARVRERAIPTE
jgi:hypothetical protein